MSLRRSVTRFAVPVFSASLLLLAGAACGPAKTPNDGVDAGPGDGDPTQPHKLSLIEVTPLNPLIELDLNMPSQQQFQAIGHFLDGTTEDLTATATWASTNAMVGTLTGNTLDIPGFATSTAQVAKISAAFDGFIGEAQITVVAYRRSGNSQDFFFILPYQDPAGDARKPLAFATAIPALDVFFMMDTTGSMGGEIANLRNSLTGTVIPGVQAAVANTQFGVGSYMDFNTGGYGGSCTGRPAGDQPFELEQAITDNITAVTAGVAALGAGSTPNGCGADWPESMIEGFYQVATGEGITTTGASVPAANIGFRQGTMPVIVAMGDAVSHAQGEPGSCLGTLGYSGIAGAHSRAEAKTALGNICARVVGVASIESCDALGDFQDFATTTGARVPPAAWDVGTRPAGCAANQCCTDVNGAGRAPDGDGLCPVVFRVQNNGAGLGTSIVTGLQMLTRFATFGVTSERDGVTTDVDGVPLPAPRTTADFLRAITPTGFVKPAPPPVLPDPTFDATSFYNVTPQTQVQFDVTAFNDFVMQTDNAQIFRATIRVLASGCTPLDQRDVLILVPPAPIVIAKPVK